MPWLLGAPVRIVLPPFVRHREVVKMAQPSTTTHTTSVRHVLEAVLLPRKRKPLNVVDDGWSPDHISLVARGADPKAWASENIETMTQTRGGSSTPMRA